VPVVTLRQPLRGLAGGAAEVAVEAGSVGAALEELERAHPALAGWILDEQRRIRPHVNVFVNGERCRTETPVTDGDVLHVVSAVSGGAR
jgi:molybdopterin synthase sulfur carrier subunit